MSIYWGSQDLKILEEFKSGNRTVRIGVIPGEPHVYDCYILSGSRCPQSGIAIATLREICSLLDINCDFVAQNETAYGDNFSGEWRGMIRRIIDGAFHTSIGNFNPTTERTKVVDFSIPIYDENTLLVTRFPEPNKFSPGAIFAFHWRAICMIFASIFIVGFLGVAFESLKRRRAKNRTEREHRSDVILWSIRRSLDAVSILLQQAPNDPHFSAAFYVLAGVWSLSCIVLIGTYSSFILAAALDVERDLPFWNPPTLGNCITNGECRMVTDSMSQSYYERIYNADSGQLLQLRKAFGAYPPKILSVHQHNKALLDKNGYNVIIMGSIELSGFLRDNPPCALDSVFLNSEYVAFPFNKKDKDIQMIFNKAISILQENGVIHRIYQEYIGSFIQGSTVCKKKIIGSEAMGVETFLGAYFAVGGGAILAFSVLLCEKANASYRQHRPD